MENCDTAGSKAKLLVTNQGEKTTKEQTGKQNKSLFKYCSSWELLLQAEGGGRNKQLSLVSYLFFIPCPHHIPWVTSIVRSSRAACFSNASAAPKIWIAFHALPSQPTGRHCLKSVRSSFGDKRYSISLERHNRKAAIKKNASNCSLAARKSGHSIVSLWRNKVTVPSFCGFFSPVQKNSFKELSKELWMKMHLCKILPLFVIPFFKQSCVYEIQLLFN